MALGLGGSFFFLVIVIFSLIVTFIDKVLDVIKETAKHIDERNGHKDDRFQG